MAITDTQKVDYLWKKIGYGRAKTDVNSIKNATNESISSPLLLRGEEVWAESYLIPSTIPGSSSNEVTVYPTSSPVECTADITASTNRTWKTGTVDWIPPEIGSTYLIKVYLHTAGDAANAASSGTQIFGAGSGNNDEWFFDYKSGVLNFIGTNLPSGISGKSVYISGAVYTGIKGVPVPGAAVSFTNVTATGIATFLAGLESSDIQIGVTAANEIDTLTSSLILDSATGQTVIDDDLRVTGVSTFVGSVTFEGGTINLGDSDTDNIVVGGEFASDLSPDVDATYNLGSASKQWRSLSLSGTANVGGVNNSGVTTTSALKGFSYLQAPHSASTQNYSVTVVSKTSAHRYNGTGSGSGYAIDGVESPILHLTPGKTYRFTLSSGDMSSHPFRFYLDADKTHAYTNDVTVTATYAEIVVTDSTPTVLHYQCSAHGYMGNAVITHSNAIDTPYAANFEETISVAGIATFTSAVDLNSDLDVDGHSELDDLNVSGVSTFAGLIDANGGLDVTGNITGAGDLTLTDTDSGNSAGPELKLYRNSASPDDGDYLGQIKFAGESDTGVERNYAKITGKIKDASNGTEDGIIEVAHIKDGSQNISARWNSEILQLINGTGFSVAGDSTFTGNIDVDGYTELDEVNIAQTLSVAGIATFASDFNVDGYTELDEVNVSETLSVAGIATFTSAVDLNSNLDVDGYTELDEVNVSETLSVAGIATFTSDVDLNANLDVDGYTELDEVNISQTLSVAGIATFTSAVDLNSNLDVDGYTELDEVNVSETLSVAGIATFTSAVDLNSNLDVDGYTELDEVNVSQTLSVAGVTTFSSNVNLNADLDLNGGATIDNVQIGVSGDNEIDTSSGDLTLDSDGGTVIVDDGLSVVGVTTFNALVDANAAAHINDLRLGTSANNEIETSAGNLVLDSATGMVYVDDDLTVAGSLYVQGSTTQVDTNSITVEDRTIELGIVNGAAPAAATTWDLGVLFNYNDGSAKKAAVAWESSVSRFVFGSQVTDGGGTGTSNPQLTYTTYAPVEIAALWVNDCAGQSQVISCTGTERHLENITIDAGTF